ncbi:unnamed protein product, partial [Prorocentrum cordatum]
MAALDRIVPTLKEIVSRFSSVSESDDNDNEMRTACDMVEKLCLSEHLAYKQRMVNDDVCIHPTNRWGLGVEFTEVHNLMTLITRGGWSWHAVGTCRAFEVPPPGEAAASIRTFNEDLVSSADGYLAPVPPAPKIATVASSHTVQVLRCISNGAKGMDSELTTDEGRISRDKVFEVCKSMEEPIKIGLEWTVFHWLLEDRVPGLAEFVQGASNIGHGSERVQSKVQTLKQISKMALNNIKKLGAAKWEAVTRVVERARPFLKGSVGHMCTYVEHYSGGDPPCFLDEVAAFVKTLGENYRDVAGQTFQCLGDAPFTDGPEWITACLKASLSCPENFLRDGQSRMWTSADMQALQGGEVRLQAIAGVAQHRACKAFLLQTCGMAHPSKQHAVAKLLGDLDVRMVMMVHNKRARTRRSFSSMAEIAAEFMKDLIEIDPAVSQFDPPVEISKLEVEKKERDGIKQYDNGVLCNNIMDGLGFEVGSKVMLKASESDDGAVMVIGAISAGQVALRGEPDKKGKVTEVKLTIN